MPGEGPEPQITAISFTPAPAHRIREGLDTINRLFEIERHLKSYSAQERKEQRNKLSRPIVEAFRAWLDSLADAVLPKSALGAAITYCRKQWPELVRFLEDGRLELDSNRAERSIKPFVMGRKAWLFANTPRGARERAARYLVRSSVLLEKMAYVPQEGKIYYGDSADRSVYTDRKPRNAIENF